MDSGRVAFCSNRDKSFNGKGNAVCCNNRVLISAYSGQCILNMNSTVQILVGYTERVNGVDELYIQTRHFRQKSIEESGYCFSLHSSTPGKETHDILARIIPVTKLGCAKTGSCLSNTNHPSKLSIL